MPAIIIHSIEMTDEQKKIIADKFISAFSEVSNVPKDRIYLFFNGYNLNEAATGGKLFSENPPMNAKAKFNEGEWAGKENTK
jgi:4-oxalocrotonate tautomerase